MPMITDSVFYFYPRPPRGGRLVAIRSDNGILNFYPRPPRGGRHASTVSALNGTVISIHALREEGDFSAMRLARHAGQFLSTPSARRATHCCLQIFHLSCISIHALREEGDAEFEKGTDAFDIFLSTPSARRATGSPCRKT